jgi:hypothetical protein
MPGPGTAEERFERAGIRGVLCRPVGDCGDAIVLTHGAGSNCQAPLLVDLSRAFADAGYLVLRFDLPFRQQRPKGPPFPALAARDLKRAHNLASDVLARFRALLCYPEN